MDPSTQAPEPVEADVERAVVAQRRLGETALRRAADGDDRCRACRHYLDAAADLAFCWHPAQRCLVDADWVCASFSADPDR